jgi:acyl homoserine lactone synthase
MIQLITAENYGAFAHELGEMHRLRYRVFKGRLGWEVQISGDREIDDFDSLHPAYLIYRTPSGQIAGCARLLPSTGPTMIRDVFPALLEGAAAPASALIWESSRFGLDLPDHAPQGEHGIAQATYELFAGVLEFGLSRDLTDIVTVTDARLERILRRVGWPLRRIGNPHPLGDTLAVAGFLEVSEPALARIRIAGGFAGPVLWAPVLPVAA